ncbi:MAG: DUF4126 domain-containing protein [Bacteroidota bacterium]|nr:DUF4126 domain-containing protein [Bacteroidota bacterium]
MDIALGILLGIGLAASCGFRVFVPMLVTSVVSLLGYIKLSPGFEWMGSWIAFAAFLIATIVEIAAFYIPWLDNALDTVSGPLAMIAGTVLTASFLTETTPLIQWALGIIVGGGTAGIVKVGASAARLTSTATTGGMANAVVATTENVMSVVLSILSFIIPIVTAFVVFLIIIYLVRKFWSLKIRGPALKPEK